MSVRKLGDTVLYYPGDHDNDAKNNAANIIPAILTQVWGDDEHASVNLKALPDGPGSLWRTSVPAYSPVPDDTNPFGSNSFYITQEDYYELAERGIKPQ